MSAQVAVVLAATGRGRVVRESVAGFLREVEGRGEVVVVEGAEPERGALTTPHPSPPPRGGRGPDWKLPPSWEKAGRAVASAEETAGAREDSPRVNVRVLRTPKSHLTDKTGSEPVLSASRSPVPVLSADLVLSASLRVLPSPEGHLVPELWRDGLRAVDAEFVAFSTTQMVPRAGWLDALQGQLDGSSAWGVGGAIAAGDRLGSVDRAVYLQRFLAYGPDIPLPARPSGENAAYRRDRLMDVEDAWAQGFWEAEVHRRLEKRGATWASASGAIVEYAGSARLIAMSRQRVAHARRFGAIRASGRGRVDRWARGLAAPAVPAVLLARAGRGLARRGMAVGPWLAAIPSFLLIAGAWTVGETLGAWSGRAGPD